MKKSFIFLISFLLIVSLFLLENSFAEERVGFVKRSWRKFLGVFKKPTPEPEKKPLMPKGEAVTKEPVADKAGLADLTKEEIIKRIRFMLEINPEVANFIPELKSTRDDKNNIAIVEYKVDGVFQDIIVLDKETLIRIHNRIASERARIQAERIQKQLEAIRATQNIHKEPPALPKVPAAPPAPPKIPKPPPPPPAPHRR